MVSHLWVERGLGMSREERLLQHTSHWAPSVLVVSSWHGQGALQSKARRSHDTVDLTVCMVCRASSTTGRHTSTSQLPCRPLCHR